MNARIGSLLTIASLSLLVAGCGGSDGDDAPIERTSKVSGAERIDKCVEKYPDSTKAECEEWEDDEQLGDDGSHREHEG